MVYKKIKVLLLCFLSVSALTSFGQDIQLNEAPAIWSLQQCIQYAKENNIQLNNLHLNKQSNEQDLAQSRLAVLPDLSGNVSQSFAHYNTIEGANSSLSASGNYGLSSSVTLYQGGYFKNDIKQKDLSVQSANLSILESKNDISLQITQTYLNILLDKENIIYAKDLVEKSRGQLEQAQQQFKAGSIARKDVVQLEAQLAADRYTLTASNNTERQDKLALKQLLQLPTEVNFDIAEPDTVTISELIPSLQEVQRYAQQNRPEIKNSELSIEIAKLSLNKAESGYKPSISAVANLGSNYLNSQSFSAFNQINNNFNQQLGLSLSIPIFSKGLNKTNVAKAKIVVDQAKLELKNSTTVLNQSVEQAYINIQNAQSQYRSAQEQLKYAEEAYRIAAEELRLGAANIVDFNQQRNQYIQAYQSNIQAKYNAALAIRIYQFYLGVPLSIN